MRQSLVAIGSIALVGAALLACAGASHQQLSLDTYAVTCKRNASNCYAEANRLCADGFDVIDAQGHHGAIVNASTSGTTTTGYAVPTYAGEMLIRCRAEPAAAPSADGAIEQATSSRH